MSLAGRDYPGSYAELLAWFRDEEACLDYLEWLRWPDGFRCRRCVGRSGWRLSSGRWECSVCGQQSSVTAGTMFYRTRTPLRMWFAAAWIMTSQKHGCQRSGCSARWGLAPTRRRGRCCTATGARWCAPDASVLRGRVEVDETWIGGVEEGTFGRDSETKSLVAIAVEIKHPKVFGRVRMQRVEAIRKECLMPFVCGAVEPGATVHGDGNEAYRTVPEHGYEHERTVQSAKGSRACTDARRAPRREAARALAARDPTKAGSALSTSTPTSTSSPAASTDGARAVGDCCSAGFSNRRRTLAHAGAWSSGASSPTRSPTAASSSTRVRPDAGPRLPPPRPSRPGLRRTAGRQMQHPELNG